MCFTHPAQEYPKAKPHHPFHWHELAHCCHNEESKNCRLLSMCVVAVREIHCERKHSMRKIQQVKMQTTNYYSN